MEPSRVWYRVNPPGPLQQFLCPSGKSTHALERLRWPVADRRKSLTFVNALSRSSALQYVQYSGRRTMQLFNTVITTINHEL